jgi:hypothetical protein
MKTLMLAVASLAATAFLFATSARAKTLDQCWGVLSRSQGELVLTRPNDEGLKDSVLSERPMRAESCTTVH